MSTLFRFFVYFHRLQMFPPCTHLHFDHKRSSYELYIVDYMIHTPKVTRCEDSSTWLCLGRNDSLVAWFFIAIHTCKHTAINESTICRERYPQRSEKIFDLDGQKSFLLHPLTCTEPLRGAGRCGHRPLHGRFAVGTPRAAFPTRTVLS